MNLELLKQDLKEAGYTQTKLEKMFDYDQTSFSKMYSGERRFPIQLFEKLCDLIKVPPCRYFHTDCNKSKLCHKIYHMDSEKITALLTILNKK